MPVDLLRPGLYVVALDRPWVETPFMFQGFRISGNNELAVLRQYCRVVEIDDDRSDATALEAARRDISDRLAAREAAEQPTRRKQRSAAAPKRPSERELRRSIGVLSSDDPHPDTDRFSTLVQAAHAARHDSREAVDSILAGARHGALPDVAATRDAVATTTGIILEDATAALWLTHLRDRDSYLASHSVNVCVLALAVGAHLGMQQGMLLQLGMGALLHSVGRARLPRAILDKPGPLTTEEMDRVRRYPEEGHDLVEAAGGVPRGALDIIRMHQERWSGSGYPQGLLGETIPRMARITGLCDAYDAMVSDRPYRAAMSPEAALHELYENASREFGAELVQAFIRVIGAFPVGSVVELDNGALGVVVGLKPGAGLRPTVLMIRAPGGEPYRRRPLLNLASERRAKMGLTGQRIRRAHSPTEVGIDVAGIVASEFGLAA